MSALMAIALFGQPAPKTERGRLLALVLQEKATRAWITRGSYAWWRYCDYVAAAQRRLIALRYPADHSPSDGALGRQDGLPEDTLKTKLHTGEGE